MKNSKTSKTIEAEEKNRKNQTKSRQDKQNIDFEKILNPAGNPFEAMNSDNILFNIMGGDTSGIVVEEIEGSDGLYVMRTLTPAGTTAKIIRYVNGGFEELASTFKPNQAI